MIVRLPLGLLNSNCYLVYDDRTEKTRSGAVVDAGGGITSLLSEISQRRVNPLYILNTHGHFDHTAGIAPLKAALQIPVGVHPADRSLLTEGGGAGIFGIPIRLPPVPELLLDDGLTLDIGSLQLSIIHTPGHTPGSICIYCPQERALFTGDTLFAGSVGRTDLSGGNARKLVASLKRLTDLPPETRVLPGHGSESTLEIELLNNPWLVGLSREAH